MKKDPQKILIVKPSSLGDVVHALPAARAIVHRWKNVRIDWVVQPAFAPLLDYCPNLGRKILFHRREMGKIGTFLPVFTRFLLDLRREKYDVVLDLQGLLRSAIFSFCARSRDTFGPAFCREFGMTLFYRHKIALPGDLLHAVVRNLFLCRTALGLDDEAPDLSPLPRHEPTARRAKELLKRCGVSLESPLFGVVPGANWESKEWPADFYAVYADALGRLRPEWKFVFFGTGKEEEKIAAIREKSALPRDRFFSLAGKTDTGVLAETLRMMRGVCGGDTGAVHLASALGVPTVSLYGPTRPERTGVYFPRNLTLRPEIDCLGCLERRCPLPENRCFPGIDPLEAAEKSAAHCENMNE